MSVYKKGDAEREREGDKKKKAPNPVDEVGKAMENIGKDMAKGWDNLFGGKEKKWDKKGGGHTLGTAADAEAARQARLAALEAHNSSGAGSSSAAPSPRRQASAPNPAAAAAMAAAEARMAGGGGPARAPSRPSSAAVAPPTSHSLSAPTPGGAFSGPGHSLAPPPSYNQEVGMLVEMGFDAAAARAALQKCGGNVEDAIGRLSDRGAAPAAPVPVSDPTQVSREAAAAMARACANDIPRLCEGLSAVPGSGTSLQMLRKLVGNVRDAPAEAKFRRVRLTNAKISAALGGRVDSFALLAACGFQLDASGEHAEIGDAAAADADALEWACVSLDQAVTMAANGGPPVPNGPMDVKVLVAPPGQPMRFDEVGEDFYALTPAEAKAIMDANAARRAKDARLMTREQRNADLAKQKRLYRKAMIRVRFPDETVLQATFSAAAPLSTVLAWVSEGLREPFHPFELALARSPPLSEMTISLEHAELAPAALLNFRPTDPAGMPAPFLKAELMDHVQYLGAEEIPRGIGGEGPSGPMGAEGGVPVARRDNSGRVPAWMKS